MKKIYSLVALAALLLLPNLQPAHASGELVISEVMYDAAGSDTGHEWVELYNPGPSSISIVPGSGAGSWRFNDGSNHVLRLTQGSQEIVAGGFLVATASSSAFLASYPSYSGTLVTTSMSLPNASATIGFTADAGLSWLAQLHYESSWGGAGDGSSLEKVDPMGADEASNWRSSPVPGGTPGQLPAPLPENHAPTAVASANRFTLINQPTLFDASASSDPDGDVLTYVWDFGDNSTGSGVAIEHSFAIAGPYEVLLTVSDGRADATSTARINVLQEAHADDDQAPVARVSGDQSGVVGQTLQFSAAESYDADGDSLEFFWDFGDGATASSVATSHSFEAEGAYQVRVSVSDSQASSSASMEVSIGGASVAEPQALAGSAGGPTAVGTVVISELLPNPVGDDRAGEFIELQNTGSSPVQVGAWALVDSRGKQHLLRSIPAADAVIQPGAFLLVPRLSSGITLGNASSTFRLLAWDSTVADTAHYGTAPEGKSWSRQASSSWAWSLPTPGSANVAPLAAQPLASSTVREILDDAPEPEVLGVATVADDAALSFAAAVSPVDSTEQGGQVEMTAVVSVAPGVAAKRLLYVVDFDSKLQQPDAGAGIAVNITSGAVPKLSVGDVVIVRGDIGQSGAERQIKVNKSGSITIIGHADFPSPERSPADSFSSESVGSLVSVSGEVVKNAAKLVTVDDGTGEVVVGFPSNGSVAKPKLKLGQILSVVGVVRAASDGLRVMPRQADEVSVNDAVDPSSTAAGTAPKSAASGTTLAIPDSVGSPLLPIGLAGAGAVLGGVIWWVRRTK